MILKAEHLIKKYKSRTVVKDVSVQVEQGEIVGLLGPNGAGKTTSFYMIVGLITPNGGRIFLDDQEITKEPVYKRAQLGVGYLAQEASVFRRLSVEDNIRAVLEMTKMTKEEQKELEKIQKEKSAFDEYDEENGYNDEDPGENLWKICRENVDRIVKICINLMKNSYQQCMEADIMSLLDHAAFEIRTVDEK